MTPETGYSVPMGAFEELKRGTQLFHVSSGLHWYNLIPGWCWVLSQQHGGVGAFSMGNPEAPRLEEVREHSRGASDIRGRNCLENHT